jgi:hypothetical protein
MRFVSHRISESCLLSLDGVQVDVPHRHCAFHIARNEARAGRTNVKRQTLGCAGSPDKRAE